MGVEIGTTFIKLLFSIEFMLAFVCPPFSVEKNFSKMLDCCYGNNGSKTHYLSGFLSYGCNWILEELQADDAYYNKIIVKFTLHLGWCKFIESKTSQNRVNCYLI